MDIKGKVVQILPMEGGTSKNGNTWQKASIIIETAANPQYPKRVKLSNMKKAGEFSKIAVGAELTFSVDIESREFNGRWYTEITCWSWGSAPQQQPQQSPAPQPQTAQQGWQAAYPPVQPQKPATAQAPQQDDDDSLPF